MSTSTGGVTDNTPNARGWVEIRVAATLTAFATAAVILRFVARSVRSLKYQLDDWLALLSLIWIFGMLIEGVMWATVGGSGKHIQTLQPNQIETFFKIFLANEFTYSITSPLVKVSLIVFYRRIFITTSFRRAADALIAMCILWGMATFISSGLQCRPIARYWDEEIPGKCFNLLEFVKGTQSVNVFLDTVILCLPMKSVWGLRRPWQDKLALSAVFLLGGFVVFASIFRLVVVFRVNLDDIPYTTYDAVVWTFVEPCVGLVCGCLPVIRSLFPAFKRPQTTLNKSGYGNSSLIHSGGVDGGSAVRPGMGMTGNADYIKMDDYSWDVSAGGDNKLERGFGNGKNGSGKILVNTTVQVAP